MKRITPYITLCVAFLFFIAASSQAQLPFNSASAPKTEMRAVWLTTIGGLDWPHSYNAEQQKEELRNILNQYKRAGINTVFLQTRVRGTTIYPSTMEPWDGCMTGHPGKAPNYDPLQFAIEECHKRGIQLHAWMVTIPVGKWQKAGSQQLRKKYPDLIRKIGEDGFMNPENPKTADYISRMCREVVSQYDVDGIHLDYIRYPETWKIKVTRQKGRENITYIVNSIYKAVKELKPWVMVSCSPIGKHDDLLRYRSGGWNARTTVCQDAQQWLKTGIMDALIPMMYFRDNNFYPFAIDWQEHSYGRIVVPGLGIYFLDPREGKWTIDVVERQMNVLRQIGMGHCFFRSKFFTDNVRGIYTFTKNFNTTQALVPAMTWMGATPPSQPSQLRMEGEGLLTWDKQADKGNGLYILYNVYASEDFPVDITKGRNVIATRLPNNQLRIDHTKRTLNYAVTAMDRYGQESVACQLPSGLPPETTIHGYTGIAISDGRPLSLPVKPAILDADYLLIENMMGQQIAIRPYRGTRLHVEGLPDGMYQIRSLGKKGQSHRLGFFSIKRKHTSQK